MVNHAGQGMVILSFALMAARMGLSLSSGVEDTDAINTESSLEMQ